MKVEVKKLPLPPPPVPETEVTITLTDIEARMLRTALWGVGMSAKQESLRVREFASTLRNHLCDRGIFAFTDY